MKLCLFALTCLFSVLSFARSNPAEFAKQSNPKPYVILVPGFFNSLVPGRIEGQPPEYKNYFSAEIVSVFKKAGYKTLIVDNLSPISSVDINGLRLIQYLQNLTQQKTYNNEELILVGHSLGGVYSLIATATQKFNIKHIYTVSTPFHGIGFVDTIFKVPGVGHFFDWINIKSITEMKPEVISAAIAKLNIPKDVQIHSFAGYQEYCLFLQCGDAAYLSPILNIPQSLTLAPSDGIVTVASSLAYNNEVIAKNGVLDIKSYQGIYIPLDHWEQVVDHKYFLALGTLNTSYIAREQTKFYKKIETLIQNR